MRPPGKISFHNIGDLRIARSAELKSFILKKVKDEGRDVNTIDIIFCDDEFLLNINQEFLQHDTYTDIITFDLSEPDGPVVAELYISVDRVRENSLNLNVLFSKELRRVIFHGILHLCGYNDKTPAEKSEMRSKEDMWLQEYG